MVTSFTFESKAKQRNDVPLWPNDITEAKWSFFHFLQLSESTLRTSQSLFSQANFGFKSRFSSLAFSRCVIGVTLSKCASQASETKASLSPSQLTRIQREIQCAYYTSLAALSNQKLRVETKSRRAWQLELASSPALWAYLPSSVEIFN